MRQLCCEQHWRSKLRWRNVPHRFVTVCFWDGAVDGVRVCSQRLFQAHRWAGCKLSCLRASLRSPPQNKQQRLGWDDPAAADLSLRGGESGEGAGAQQAAEAPHASPLPFQTEAVSPGCIIHFILVSFPETPWTSQCRWIHARACR